MCFYFSSLNHYLVPLFSCFYTNSRFIDDHEEMISKVSTVQLHALVALIKAGPTTTHTELFDKMINDEVKEYAQV